ncbi:MAG: HAD-IIIA family hydrolase [Candidatus Omnitrophota bacterium]
MNEANALDAAIAAKAGKVKLLLLDVDGVLTDGRIVYDSKGRDSKFFDVHDGMGVYLLRRAGIPTVLVTAKSSKAILPRARDMRIAKVYAELPSKSRVLEKIKKKYNVDPEEICFVGDDLVDLCLMNKVGLAIAVFNACPEIKQAAAYITIRHGGRGAVREVSELILKSKGRWKEMVRLYDI